MHNNKCILLLFILITSCKKESTIIPENNNYSIIGNYIIKNNFSVQVIGSNALHIFSPNVSDMNNWNIDIVREFVGNVKEVNLIGNIVLDANKNYLYPLQTLVDSNRKNNKITIICPFGWTGTNSLFTGTMPQKVYWWNDFKIKLKEWALHFKNQPDVWIEVWNEPYRYDRLDGFTNQVWVNDMNEMVNIIRSTGNNNIILVPCAEQGQDESILITEGISFINKNKNILFDIHGYEKWLLVPDSNVITRLQKIQHLPIIFGEIAPLNAGQLMNPTNLLNYLYNYNISFCAWLWKYDETDKDALLDSKGNPNNNYNNNWGSTYKQFCLKPRKKFSILPPL